MLGETTLKDIPTWPDLNTYPVIYELCIECVLEMGRVIGVWVGVLDVKGAEGKGYGWITVWSSYDMGREGTQVQRTKVQMQGWS